MADFLQNSLHGRQRRRKTPRSLRTPTIENLGKSRFSLSQPIDRRGIQPEEIPDILRVGQDRNRIVSDHSRQIVESVSRRRIDPEFHDFVQIRAREKSKIFRHPEDRRFEAGKGRSELRRHHFLFSLDEIEQEQPKSREDEKIPHNVPRNSASSWPASRKI